MSFLRHNLIQITWDNVDEEYLKAPRKWDATSIGKFMLSNFNYSYDKNSNASIYSR